MLKTTDWYATKLDAMVPVKKKGSDEVEYKSFEEITQTILGKDSNQEATIYFVIPANKLARERMYWALGKLREIYANKIKILEKISKYSQLAKQLNEKNSEMEMIWIDLHKGDKEPPERPDSFLSQDDQIDLDEIQQNLEMYKIEYDRIVEYKPELYSLINQTLDSLRLEFVSTAFGASQALDVEDRNFKKYDESSFNAQRIIRNDDER